MTQSNELYHHGIKGMKWGKRRFQNKDGSLTPAGKKRYDDSESSTDNSSTKSAKKSRYDKLYEKYKAIGYSDERARKTAKGRVAAERSLMVIGGITVAAAIAYAGYRYYDSSVDRYIAPGTAMQTVHRERAEKRLDPGNPFYATYQKKDNEIYSSRVFSHFTSDSNVTRFYTKDGIKVASEKTGRKIFNELVNTNPEIANYSKRMGHFKNGKKAYEMFNYSLVLRNNSDTAKKMGVADLNHDRIHNIFYNELKKRGYGAIIDTNDAKREGWTFNPVIVFDSQKKHIMSTTKATAEHLSAEHMREGLRYSKLRKFVLNPLKNPVITAQGIAFVSAMGIEAKRSSNLNARLKFVEQYKKTHPNTVLTDSEIVSIRYSR